MQKNIDNYTTVVYNKNNKEKKERHNIAISKTVWDLAVEKANDNGLSVSAFIAMLIKKY